MSVYDLALGDEQKPVHLIHTPNRDAGRYEVLSAYKDLVCPKCGKFSFDKVFERGFDSVISIARRKDLLLTGDGFYCCSGRFRSLVEKHHWPGLDFKRIGVSEWFVINVTQRFPIVDNVFRTVRGPCDVCGRVREEIGSISHEGEFLRLPESDIFFSTERFREGSAFADRDIFATGKVAKTLKAEGIKGGVLRLILDEATYAAQKTAIQQKMRVKVPPNAFIFLKRPAIPAWERCRLYEELTPFRTYSWKH